MNNDANVLTGNESESNQNERNEHMPAADLSQSDDFMIGDQSYCVRKPRILRPVAPPKTLDFLRQPKFRKNKKNVAMPSPIRPTPRIRPVDKLLRTQMSTLSLIFLLKRFIDYYLKIETYIFDSF